MGVSCNKPTVALTDDADVPSSTVNSMQEPTLPLHLQSVWGYNSDKVGLVYMAALVPALICGHLLVAYS